ncbi:hypothetical protein KIN20_011584 [Parelaphostrongylus tenuis]|uniref:Uncharacterized protein n=1 Tax=Parelaphostrongylus tenuis TaxID=148309 RepID=A0AAD5QM58_PARTN|nr:hypothetical protein KIN20_011584 [Parelaphostrongylus tenuis]
MANMQFYFLSFDAIQVPKYKAYVYLIRWERGYSAYEVPLDDKENESLRLQWDEIDITYRPTDRDETQLNEGKSYTPSMASRPKVRITSLSSSRKPDLRSVYMCYGSAPLIILTVYTLFIYFDLPKRMISLGGLRKFRDLLLSLQQYIEA